MDTQIEVSKGKRFETHNFFTKFLRVFSIPLINNIPSSLLKNMAGASSHDANKIIKTVGSTHALEVMYSRHKRKLFSRGILQGIADFFWHHVISQLKAIRNRLKIVEERLEEELTSLINSGRREIKIMTVGGGSCRAIIHTISKLKEKYPQVEISIINIDKDPKAIELGKDISKTFGVEDRFNWINESASNISSFVKEDSIDVVEMVGLLDYFWEEKAIRVMSQIYNTLKENGFFIVANVYPNSETRFVEKIGWPKMCYRNVQEFENVIRNSGFKKNLKIIFEPLKIHIVGVARK